MKKKIKKFKIYEIARKLTVACFTIFLPCIICITVCFLAKQQYQVIHETLQKQVMNEAPQEFVQNELAKDYVESTWVSSGIAIIGIAVSVWLGLNIFSFISKREIDDLRNEVVENSYEYEQFMLKMEMDRIKNILEKTANKYELSKIWIDLLSEEDMEDKAHEVYEIENLFSQCCNYYETTQHKLCIENSIECLKRVKRLQRHKKILKKKETDLNVLDYYLLSRESELLFYKNISTKKNGRNKASLEELQESIDLFDRLIVFIESKDLDGEQKKLIREYFNNSTGYTYFEMYNISTDKNYLKSALDSMNKTPEEQYTKSRYLCNLGAIYMKKSDIENKENKENLEMAIGFYEKAIGVNTEEYKAYNNLANAYIKKFEMKYEKEVGKEREKCLFQANTKEWDIGDIEKAEYFCHMCININYGFNDAHYLLAKAYGYHFLKTQDKEWINRADEEMKYFEFLKKENINGYMYTKRFIYELVEANIKEAENQNNKIIDKLENSKDKGDTKQIRELYTNTIRKRNKEEMIHYV